MIPIAAMVAGTNSTAHALAPPHSETFTLCREAVSKATMNISSRKGAFILRARAQMCGSSCRGQEPAANTFVLDLNEGLTVELDLVGIGFRHQIIYPMLCVCSTTDFESAVLVLCQSIERWDLGFQRTDQQHRCALQARVCLLTQNNDRARN